jgi:hypothetical protein
LLRFPKFKGCEGTFTLWNILYKRTIFAIQGAPKGLNEIKKRGGFIGSSSEVLSIYIVGR